MSPEELTQRRMRLERGISEMVKAFEEETGRLVRDVAIRRVRTDFGEGLFTPDHCSGVAVEIRTERHDQAG